VEIDIIKDPLFKMKTISIDLKHKGLAKVNHTEAIEPEDLKTKCTQACH
jgi:hypothetical protein